MSKTLICCRFPAALSLYPLHTPPLGPLQHASHGVLMIKVVPRSVVSHGSPFLVCFVYVSFGFDSESESECESVSEKSAPVSVA